MKKPYQIVTRAAKESAAVVEQFCQSNGQMLMPIVNLMESASQVVESVIHEIQIHVLETIFARSRSPGSERQASRAAKSAGTVRNRARSNWPTAK